MGETFNPILQRFYQNLQNRALDQQSNKVIKEFESLFPTKIIPKKQVKKERKHWNDINDELDNLFGDVIDDDNHNKKEEKEEEEEEEDIDIELDSLIVVNEIKKIGTTNPINDFNKL